MGGVYTTRLVADDIGFSILPDTSDLIGDRFLRDTVTVVTGIAPDLTVVAGLPLGGTTMQLAVGYAFGGLEVRQADATRDAGTLAVGHAIVAVEKPVGGFRGRVGAGVLWMHGGEVAAVEEMRAINPVFELGVGRRWPWRGLAIDAGVAAHAVHLTSEAIDVRGGQAGFVYRVGIELGVTRRFGR